MKSREQYFPAPRFGDYMYNYQLGLLRVQDWVSVTEGGWIVSTPGDVRLYHVRDERIIIAGCIAWYIIGAL